MVQKPLPDREPQTHRITHLVHLLHRIQKGFEFTLLVKKGWGEKEKRKYKFQRMGFDGVHLSLYFHVFPAKHDSPVENLTFAEIRDWNRNRRIVWSSMPDVLETLEDFESLR